MKAALLLAGCLATGGALAQRAEIEPSAAVRCLTAVDGEPGVPDYPAAALKLNRTATVQAQLVFTGPGLAPAVDLSVQGGDSFAAEFKDAVRQHVTRLRVPCMAADGAPVRLTRIYEFRPDTRRVFWGGTTDQADAARAAAMNCVVHTGNLTAPPYPTRAESEGVRGRVVAQVRFVGPDVPPEARIHSRVSARPLKRAAEVWIHGLRMPCHPGGVVESTYQFVFLLGNQAYGMKPMTLLQLLGGVRGLRQRGLTIDTTAMGCPFDLHFHFRQPHLANRVGEVGGTDPARRPLIELLEQADLMADDATLDSVYGDETIVTVPCVKIAIQPQEKPT